jgi:putative phosphoribosyl transferase
VEGREVRISAGPVELEGILDIPESAQGIVLFAHGSGSGRHSPRNRFVAGALRKAGLATLLKALLRMRRAQPESDASRQEVALQ